MILVNKLNIVLDVLLLCVVMDILLKESILKLNVMKKDVVV